MPEYVFKHDKNLSSLYIPFYQFFMTRWNDPNVPEYDLESDELTYRDTAGNEVSREKLNELDAGTALRVPPPLHPVSKNASPLGRLSIRCKRIEGVFVVSTKPSEMSGRTIYELVSQFDPPATKEVKRNNA
jgi:hypothetical protein